MTEDGKRQDIEVNFWSGTGSASGLHCVLPGPGGRGHDIGGSIEAGDRE